MRDNHIIICKPKGYKLNPCTECGQNKAVYYLDKTDDQWVIWCPECHKSLRCKGKSLIDLIEHWNDQWNKLF